MSPPEPSCHPALLVELIIENILIRCPPDEPECLARASVVCKGWHRVLDDPGFRRRYSKFHHRKPPMLGLLHNVFTGSGYDSRFAATTTFSPQNPLLYDSYVFDSRHGLVLSASFEFPRNEDYMLPSLIVSDPITGVHVRVPFPRTPGTGRLFDCWNAAVFCAGDGCDHMDCHGNPFLVAFVGCNNEEDSDLMKYACVYTSEAGTWSRFTCCKHPYAMDNQQRSVLLDNNTVYFPCERGAGIMEYNLGEQKLSWFDAPLKYHHETNYFLVTAKAEDGNNQLLGFVRECARNDRMYMWTARVSDDANNGALAWGQQPRVIELHKLQVLPGGLRRVICFVEGAAGAILFDSHSQWLAMADLNSLHVRKLASIRTSIEYDIAIPYKSFYTPRTSLERAQGLFQKGSVAMAARDFVHAVRCLRRAYEIRAAFYGELSPECATTCYKYGFALLRKAQEGTGLHTIKSVRNEESGLDMAWKMLDNARVIVEKSPDDTMEKKVKIFSALAAVSMEREDIDNSLDECFKALAILDDLIEPDHHQIIKLNCLMRSVSELAFKAGDAIPCCAKAISLCNERARNLKKASGNIRDNASSAEKTALEDAMELLIGILVEYEKKLQGLEQELLTPTPAACEVAIASEASGGQNNAEIKPRRASFVYPMPKKSKRL